VKYVATIPEIADLFRDADHVDTKQGECDKTLRAFVAACLSYMPGWMRFLLWIRAGFVRLLGMRQEGIPKSTRMNPEDVSFTPGEPAAFFTVVMAEEERFWMAVATDKHLSGYLAVVVEALDDGRKRFHVCTIVKYHHWTGPLYFNVIRLFHHFVIWAMIRQAVK
jgi:hypothetical protein